MGQLLFFLFRPNYSARAKSAHVAFPIERWMPASLSSAED